MTIQSKLPDVGVTIFTVMTQLAIENNAINLSQGFPDFDAHPELIDLVNKYMTSGNNQYAPMQGLTGLRRQIADKVESIYGTIIDPETEWVVDTATFRSRCDSSPLAGQTLKGRVTHTIVGGEIRFEGLQDPATPIERIERLTLEVRERGVPMDSAEF